MEALEKSKQDVIMENQKEISMRLEEIPQGHWRKGTRSQRVGQSLGAGKGREKDSLL